MFHIFQAKIYKDQIFYNDLFYLYFGEGYITNFTVDDIKAGRCVLSHQAYYKREKMTLYQVMNIYNHSQAIYKRFTNFYNTEFHKKDHIFYNFFSILPQFSVNYNTNINSDGNNEYVPFIFLDRLKLFEHHIIQERNLSEKINKIDSHLSNEHPDMNMNFNTL